MANDLRFNLALGRDPRTPILVTSISTTSLDAGTAGAAYSFQLVGVNVSPNGWSLQSGTLPTGVTLSASGLLSGTPTQSGTFGSLVFRATGPDGYDEKTLSLEVAVSGFSDDFNRADAAPGANWGGISNGTITIVSNKLKFAGTTGSQYGRAYWTANQIPATWDTITVTVKVKLSDPNFDNEPAIVLCMDDPPSGGVANAGEMIQNGYGVIAKPTTFNEEICRIHSGARTLLLDSNLSSLSTTETEFKAVFTKLSDRVRIQMFWGGSQLGSDVDDTDANRKTGACYVGLNALAASGQTVNFDDFDVAYTVAA